MEVKLGPSRSANIPVNEGDDPAKLAHQFCLVYSLDSSAFSVLTEVVRQNMQAHGIPMTESDLLGGGWDELGDGQHRGGGEVDGDGEMDPMERGDDGGDLYRSARQRSASPELRRSRRLSRSPSPPDLRHRAALAGEGFSASPQQQQRKEGTGGARPHQPRALQSSDL